MTFCFERTIVDKYFRWRNPEDYIGTIIMEGCDSRNYALELTPFTCMEIDKELGVMRLVLGKKDFERHEYFPLHYSRFVETYWHDQRSTEGINLEEVMERHLVSEVRNGFVYHFPIRQMYGEIQVGVGDEGNEVWRPARAFKAVAEYALLTDKELELKQAIMSQGNFWVDWERWREPGITGLVVAGVLGIIHKLVKQGLQEQVGER